MNENKTPSLWRRSLALLLALLMLTGCVGIGAFAAELGLEDAPAQEQEQGENLAPEEQEPAQNGNLAPEEQELTAEEDDGPEEQELVEFAAVEIEQDQAADNRIEETPTHAVVCSQNATLLHGVYTILGSEAGHYRVSPGTNGSSEPVILRGSPSSMDWSNATAVAAVAPVAEGEYVQIQFAADTGYYLKNHSVYIKGGDATEAVSGVWYGENGATPSFSFTVPANKGNYTLYIDPVFVLRPCAITLNNATGHGTVTAAVTRNGSTYAPNEYADFPEDENAWAGFGDTVTLTLTPEENYTVKYVIVNGSKLDPVNGVYSFTMPAGDVTVSAYFVYGDHTHSFLEPTWTWAEDHSSATATFACNTCTDELTLNATVTHTVTTAATYQAPGSETFTATVELEGVTYTKSVDVTIPCLERDVTVTYCYVNGGSASASATKLVGDESALSAASANDGWYAVTENVTIGDRIEITGSVNLILCDGATLTAPKGIHLAGDNSLTIYGQSGGSGALTITGPDSKQAGIGGNGASQNTQGETCGCLTVNGGTVTVTGGPAAAAIGGGWAGNGGAVTVNGGTVIANAGENGAAGIGGGYLDTEMTTPGGRGGTVTVTGGTVNATGSGGAGIGSGNGGNANIGGPTGADGGTVMITGGTVTATGGSKAAGIGGGMYGDGGSITINGGNVTAAGGIGGAGIGGGEGGYKLNEDPVGTSGGTITIDGGTVTAHGGASSAGIGCGLIGEAGTITINGGTIVADGGYGIAGSSGSITINGGVITANGASNGGTGIGDTDNYSVNVAINGGQITAGNTGGAGIEGVITLGWTNESDFIEAANCYGTATVAEGKMFVTDDDTPVIITGAILNGENTSLLPSISGKKLIPHAHNYEHIDAVAPTYNAATGKYVDGSIEHWACAGCATYYADEQLQNPLTAAELAVPYFKLDKNNEGVVRIMKYNGADPFVRVPDTVPAELATNMEAGEPITSINQSAFKGNTVVTKVILGDNISHIGYQAFMDCSNLLEVEIGSGLRQIYAEAFYGCANLLKITCTATEEVTFGKFILSREQFNSIQFYGYHVGGFRNAVTSGTYVPANTQARKFYGLDRHSDPNWTWASDFSSAQATFDCASCSFTLNAQAYVSSAITQEPSCTEAGTKTYTAQVVHDGSTYSDVQTEPIAKLAHATSHTAAVTPTYNAETNTYTNGNIEYWHCADCGKCFSDEACEHEITEASVARPYFVFVKEDVDKARMTRYYGADAEVTVPDTVPAAFATEAVPAGTKIVLVGTDTFRGNTTITKVSMGDNITKLIWEGFKNCTNLEEIEIGSGLTAINSDVFIGCSSLKKVTCTTTEGSITVTPNPFDSSNIKTVTFYGYHSGSFREAVKEINRNHGGPGKFVGIDAHSAPTWTWAENYSSATARFDCASCSYKTTEALDAVVTASTQEATVYADGLHTYTAKVTVDGLEYRDVKTVAIPRPSFRVTISEGIEGGTVTADPQSAHAGETVTLTAAPDASQHTAKWTVTDANGDPVVVTDNSFVMPAADVTVSADFGVFHNIRVVSESVHGTVTAPAYAKEGSTVTLTVAPEKGYAINSLTYNWRADDGYWGHFKSLYADADGNWTFVMPEATEDVWIEFEFQAARTVTLDFGANHAALAAQAFGSDAVAAQVTLYFGADTVVDAKSYLKNLLDDTLDHTIYEDNDERLYEHGFRLGLKPMLGYESYDEYYQETRTDWQTPVTDDMVFHVLWEQAFEGSACSVTVTPLTCGTSVECSIYGAVINCEPKPQITAVGIRGTDEYNRCWYTSYNETTGKPSGYFNGTAVGEQTYYTILYYADPFGYYFVDDPVNHITVEGATAIAYSDYNSNWLLLAVPAVHEPDEVGYCSGCEQVVVYDAQILGMNGYFADFYALNLYVKTDVENPSFDLVRGGTALPQVTNRDSFCSSRQSVYYVEKVSGGGENALRLTSTRSEECWMITIKIFTKHLTTPVTLTVRDGEKVLNVLGYSYNGIGSSGVATSHEYSFVDYTKIMATWKNTEAWIGLDNGLRAVAAGVNGI